MEITCQISIYEIAILITSVIAGGFALFQWHQSYVLKRAELVKEASNKIREDADIASVLYTIDYSEHWYNDAFLEDHQTESQFDKAFAYFNYICYLKKKRIFTNDEFRIFEYRIQRMAQNESFVIYLFNLYHFSKRQGRDISFYYLLDYMEENKFLCDDFWDASSKRFKDDIYLNI